MKTTFDPKSNLTGSDLEEADTLRLRFDSHDDALNYARKLVDDTAHWPELNELNVADLESRQHV